MRVVLCHHCWTWGFPNGAHCAECKRVIALDEPDPSAADLGELLGTVTTRLVRVAWDRPKLPSRGEVWGTTTGLLFWPTLVQQPNGAIVPLETGARAVSSWSFFTLWRRVETITAMEDPVALKVESPSVGVALGQGFLDAPGAAFFPCERVVKITCRSRVWILHRTVGRSLRLMVQPTAAEGSPVWKAFFQQEAWRRIAVVS